MQWDSDKRSFLRLLFWYWSIEFWASRLERLICEKLTGASFEYWIEDSLMDG